MRHNLQSKRAMYRIEGGTGIRWVTPYKSLTSEPTNPVAHAAMVDLARSTLEEIAPAFLEIANAFDMAVLLGEGPTLEVAVPVGDGSFRTVPLPDVAMAMAARSAGVRAQPLPGCDFNNAPPALRH